MYPIHGDYWLVGVSPSEDYDGDYGYNYADEEYDYDEYLFWPSSAPHILVPANGAEHSGLEVVVLSCPCHRNSDNEHSRLIFLASITRRTSSVFYNRNRIAW